MIQFASKAKYILALYSLCLVFQPSIADAANTKGRCSSVVRTELSQHAIKEIKRILVDESLKQGRIIGIKEWLVAMKLGLDKKTVDALKPITNNFSKSTTLLAELKAPGLSELFASNLKISTSAQTYKKEMGIKIGHAAVDHLSKNFTPPKVSEIVEKLSIDKKIFKAVFTEEDLKSYWKTALKNNPRKLEDMREKLISSVTRYFQQSHIPKARQKVLSEPTSENLLENLIKTKTNSAAKEAVEKGRLDIKHIQRLVGEREEWQEKLFLTPVLFDSIEALLKSSYLKSPTAFNSFRPQKFGKEYADETLEIIKRKNRFLTVSVTAGIPLNEDQLKSMLQYAEKRDAVILAGLTNKNYMAIPDVLINNPHVRIVSHTFDLGSELRLWDIPIYPKNKNPFASLNERGQGERGQTQIVFNTQLMLKSVTIAGNSNQRHELWSTGSLNKAIYPYKSNQSGRVSETAVGRHFNGFLVLEKSDAKSGMTKRGTPGQWHIRPVTFVDDTKHDGRVGFTDIGKHYAPDGTISDMDIMLTSEGDNHERYQNQNMLLKILEEFPAPKIGITFDDLIDGDSHNHWEKQSPTSQSQRAEAGRNSIMAEINELIAMLNQRLLRTPDDVILYIKDANHGDWLSRTLEKMPTEPENQKLIDMLRRAVTTYKIHPIEYVTRILPKEIQSMPAEFRMKLSDFVVPLIQPERVVFQKIGEPLSTGPSYRQNENGFHGHKGPSGKSSSDESDARAMDGGTTGHRHSTSILTGFAENGQLIINVGVSGDLDMTYARGGYSNWAHGFRTEYEDGTAQLFTFKRAINSFYSKDENGYLPPDQFFTREPQVIERNNDLMNPDNDFYVEDQYTRR